MIIRFFDILISFICLIASSPLFITLALAIRIDSKGGVFYTQERVGINGTLFRLYKFRSMYLGSDKNGLITVGNDSRVTPVGRFLRKHKLDELPQLFNVLKGNMSMVGPRPEVKRYVDLLTKEQRVILTVKPGITDYASIFYIDESKLLAESDNPERIYVEEIMPHKIELNMVYVLKPSLVNYLKILTRTVFKFFKR